ncbi:MAG: SRPBCC family protein [Kiritimatiellae bacterium]|nr:SRPBCC family protein [Kiritimatiellia bacterium]MDW8457823.1 SRPBCC family protein [Verrucomicrobiota bacterium]
MNVEIARNPSGGYTLLAELWLPRPVNEVFPFFASAENLERITPPYLRFEILTPRPIEMRRGTLIDYRIRLRGLPIRWRTEISIWEPPFRFVDTQLRGPYRQWIHEHTFEERDGGTLCRDRVDYKVPGGEWVHRLFVKKDVRDIFVYRQNALLQIFNGSLAAH